jgi:hypothetical protein
MKKITNVFIALLFSLSLVVPVAAQHVEITPFVGYSTSAKTDAYYNGEYADMKIHGGMNFGGAISIGLTSENQLEFSYNHLRTTLDFEKNGLELETLDYDVDYYMLGVLRELPLGKPVTPYGSLALGLVNYRSMEADYDSEQLFNVDLSLGLKVKLKERVGLRIQARMHVPLIYEGLYIGTGGAGLGGTAVFVQGDFTGGIYFVLK